MIDTTESASPAATLHPGARGTLRTDGRPIAGARSIQIVATPGSGIGAALTTAHRLRDALRARGHGVTLETFGDLARLRRWATTVASRVSLLIAVGGDGTQSTAASAAVRRSIPFLSVPSGFGNLFARAFGHVPDVEGVVELLEHGELVDADVGVRNRQLFLDQESFGVLVEIQERVEAGLPRPRARWRRWVAYYRGALHYLRHAPLPAVHVTVDGHVVARDATIVTVANVDTYGPWLPLTPAASPIDGFLDVFVMRAGSKRELLARLLRRHLGLPALEQNTRLCRGRRVSVAASGSARDQLELTPGALPVVVSRTTARRLREAAGAADPRVDESRPLVA